MERQNGIRWLSARDIAARRSVHLSTVWRAQRDGRLPPPVYVSTGASRWPEHEIDAIDRALLRGTAPQDLKSLVQNLVAARGGAE